MLEFLKNKDEDLYIYAKDIEDHINSFSVCVTMQTFLENILKRIYIDSISENLYGMNLYDLATNTRLISYMKSNYGFYDFDTIKVINKAANEVKHSGGKGITFDKLVNAFNCVFLIANRYCNLKESFDNQEFCEMVKKASSENVNELCDEIQSLKDEKNKLLSTLFELKQQVAENELNKNKVKELECEIETLNKKINEKNVIIENAAPEEEINLVLNDIYLDEKESLEKRKNEIIKKTRIEKPQCNVCGSPMEVSHFSDTWYCPNYKYHKGKPKTNVSVAAYKNQRPSIEEKTIDDKISRLERIRLDVKQMDTYSITIREYPVFEREDYASYFFNCLGIPNIDTETELLKSRYSSFIVDSKLSKVGVDAQSKLIYSLIVRLLNRGIVLRVEDEVNKQFFKRYGKGKFNTLDLLNAETFIGESISSFADKVFSVIYGKNYNNYLLYNAPCSLIDSSLKFNVSILIYNGKNKLAIDLDTGGNEKKQALQEYDVNYFKFNSNPSDEEIKNIIDILLGYIDVNEDHMEIPVTLKHFKSSMIYNQISIAIAKLFEQGLLKHNSLSIKSFGSLLSQEDLNFILNLAKERVISLIKHFEELYNIKCDYSFEGDSDIEIVIDGIKAKSGQICIRSINYREKYIPLIEKFARNIYPTNVTATNLKFFLNFIFGYKSFNEGQFEAIKRLLLRKDSIILLPTGAGKSIIYQLSSFLVPGIIFVISPLKSLMEDQVYNLNYKFGISNAFQISSSLDKNEIVKIYKLLNKNIVPLLYIAPERLQIDGFRKEMKNLLNKNLVYTLAIDEAHCVSEWGHDFRPSYLNLGHIARNQLTINDIDGKYVPNIIGLTGTASDSVLKDIKRDLEIADKSSIVLPSSFDRKELNFEIVPCKLENKYDVLKEKLLSLTNVDEKGQCGIVFAPFANGKNQIYSANWLRHELTKDLKTINIGCYFSTPPKNPGEKESSWSENDWNRVIRKYSDEFKKDKIDVLVATKAYGMGIDKPNIRFVIHDGMPPSIYDYYQEVGRAGRDRKESKCITLFTNENKKENEDYLKRHTTKTLSSNDDMGAISYFHSTSFPEKSKIIEDANKFIDRLEAALWKEEEGKLKSFIKMVYSDSNKEQEKKDIGIIIKLIKIGVISDYYRNNDFMTLIREKDSLEKESIVNHYFNYVKIFDHTVAKQEKEKMEQASGFGWIYVKNALEILISFVDERIESSKRNEIRQIYDMMNEAIKYKGQEQNDFVRERVIKHIHIENNAERIVKGIFNGENCGYEEVLDLLNIYENDSVQEFDYSGLYGALERSQIDPARARHPGLKLALCLINMAQSNYSSDFSDKIVDSYYDMLNYYKLKPEIVDSFFSRFIRTMLDKNLERFDEFYYEKLIPRFNAKKKNGLEVYSHLIDVLLKSNELGDEHKKYILFKYMTDKLNLI